MNSLPLFCLDTHAIYRPRIAFPKLSAAAAQVFDEGVRGKATLIVPYVVVAELFYVLHRHGATSLFAPLFAGFQTFPSYRLEPLALSGLAALDSVADIPAMFGNVSGHYRAIGGGTVFILRFFFTPPGTWGS